MQETQQLVTIVPWTFIAQILNLFIQMYLIKRFLFRPVMAVLDKRRAMADAEIADAKKAKADAESMKEDYEKNLAGAKAEAAQLLAEAQKTAAAKSESILAEAAQQAGGLKAKAEADIAMERRRAVNEIKDEIGSIAMDIAGKVIEREVNEEDHRKLIDEFIENVGEAS